MFNKKKLARLAKEIRELQSNLSSAIHKIDSLDRRVPYSSRLEDLVSCIECGQVFKKDRCVNVQYGYYCEKHMDRGAPHEAALYWTKKRPDNAVPVIKAAKTKAKKKKAKDKDTAPAMPRTYRSRHRVKQV